MLICGSILPWSAEAAVPFCPDGFARPMRSECVDQGAEKRSGMPRTSLPCWRYAFRPESRAGGQGCRPVINWPAAIRQGDSAFNDNSRFPSVSKAGNGAFASAVGTPDGVWRRPGNAGFFCVVGPDAAGTGSQKEAAAAQASRAQNA